MLYITRIVILLLSYQISHFVSCYSVLINCYSSMINVSSSISICNLLLKYDVEMLVAKFHAKFVFNFVRTMCGDQVEISYFNIVGQ